jgi:hypothetical protein
MMKSSITCLALLGMLALAVPVSAQTASIQYVGFSWEDGGMPPSDPGDVLHFVGTATAASPIFEVDLGIDELTFYMYDLVSTGQYDIGDGTLVVEYTGGTLEIYRDPQQNADFGTFPPNGTAPSSFTDGSLFFRGPFIQMTVVLYTDGTGEYVGELNGTEGEMIEEACFGCVFTFGGTFGSDAGAQVPDGYDYQVVGTLEVDEAVSTQDSSWSRVKALFN